jgi:hypothetical protein
VRVVLAERVVVSTNPNSMRRSPAMENEGCIDCGQRIAVTDGCEHFTQPPYWWGWGGDPYCLACWLGVGSNDLLGVDAAK